MLALIAEQQAELGRRDAALATARAIADEGPRSLALAQLAETLNDPGLAAEAVALAARATDADMVEAQSALARAEASTGRTAEAMATAQAIVVPFVRDDALGAIAAAQVRAGRAAEAMQLALGIGDRPLEQAWVLATIAPALPE